MNNLTPTYESSTDTDGTAEEAPLNKPTRSSSRVPPPGASSSRSSFANMTTSNIRSSFSATVRLVRSSITMKRVKSPEYSFGLSYLFNNMDADVVDPVIFLKAAGEVLFIALGLSWILTAIFRPETIRSNPLKDRLGYNNLCVGWDMPPASYIAAALVTLSAYLTLRFNFLSLIRNKLLLENNKISQKQSDFAKFSTYWYACAICCVPLIFLISPYDNVWAHGGLWHFFIIGRLLAVCSQYVLFPEEFETMDKVFLAFYSLVSGLIFAMTVFNFTFYSLRGEMTLIYPVPVEVFVDYTWFVCVGLTAKFLPNKTLLSRSLALVAVYDEVV